MTIPDHAWAPTTTIGASGTPPPTLYPPSVFEYPAPRPKRRRPPRWIIGAAIAAVVVAGAGFGGWALHGAQSPSAAPVSPPPAVPAQGLSPDQAKQKMCGSYQSLALQWVYAYRHWKDALPEPWSWSDPPVKAATADFDATSYQVTAQLAQLAEPNAPADVTDAVRNVRQEIISLATSHLHPTTPVVTNSYITSVNRAMNTADNACGFTR